ncbi:MAG: GNAT family N-acetyltransferase [Aequorivita sp.]
MNVVDNKEKRRFEAFIDGYPAIVEYSVEPGVIVLEHAEVDPALKGRGVASDLVENVLLQIELLGLKVVPECPFIKKYIEKHPEWESILVDPK